MSTYQDPTLLSRSNKKSKLPLLLGCFVVLVVLLGAVLLVIFFYSTTRVSGQSIIFIRSPQNGDLLVAGEPIQVRALARDDDNVTRIELWVDNTLVDVQESTVSGGINPFPLLTTWYPSEGVHTMIVRAFDGRNNSFQATIYITATALADRDGDGIADDVDACPDQPGSGATEGCPDRDFDGIADLSDSCPDIAGLPPDGCTASSENDRDGDGMLDSADACPDEVGSPLADGCPDADSDGTPDSTDACPAEPGAGADGCSESADSLPPDLGGGGEPPMPRPGEEPPDPADDEDPILPFDVLPLPEMPISLEVEATMLWTRHSYERVWCYVQLGEEDPRRYDFETEDRQVWNIEEELGGENSVRLLHNENAPLAISISCLGANTGEEPERLEEFSVFHPAEEWDGRSLEMHPEGENTIDIRYHICSPSCDETTLQIPLLAPITTGPTGNGPYRLRWRWEGNESDVSGFLVRRTVITPWDEEVIWINDPAARALDLADYIPACGETAEFSIIVFRNTETGNVFSPRSNIVSWSADPCTYSANVTFTTLDVHNPPADEDGLHRPGPIYGEFWVSNGTTIESIEFNACWCYFGPGMTFWGTCDGLELQIGTYAIDRDIFGWINREQASCIGNGCRSNSFYAPDNASLHIPFEDGDTLTVGGRIMDCDARNANDVVFEEQSTYRVDINSLNPLTEPIPFGLTGDHINLNTFLRMGH